MRSNPRHAIILACFLTACSTTPVSQTDTEGASSSVDHAQVSSASDTSVTCSGVAIPSQSEGPYYTTNTPERTNITEEGTVGTPLILTGRVLDEECNPIAGAWIDFWQADGNGEYDNVGFELRGHQFTDDEGRYRLETVVPSEYPGRPPHIHLKVQAHESSPIITSQLYFPDRAGNATDSLFRPETIVHIVNEGDTVQATYDLIVSRE